MKRSPWPCPLRVIDLVVVAIRNSYQQSNMDLLTLFARFVTMATSNMKVASIMLAVPSMVFMSLYGKQPPMVSLLSTSVSTRSAALDLCANKLS